MNHAVGAKLILRNLAIALAIAAGGVAAAQQPANSGRFMVFFDWGKPEIRSDDTATLDQVAAGWSANPGDMLDLAGHTDRSGSASHNLRASRLRAEMVRDELLKRGVAPANIRIRAYGEDRPLVPTEDGVREVQNRRVEITFRSISR